MEGGAERSEGIVARLIKPLQKKEGGDAQFLRPLPRLVSFLVFPLLFPFPPPTSCFDGQHPLGDAASGSREWQGEERERCPSAQLTGMTLTVALMWKGSVVAAKRERAHTG